MKKASRKRLIVSSASMLLVSALALGTATYAWFTSSTTATANGINVRTIQSSELVISKSDKVWNTMVDYGVSQRVLQPASTVNGSAWFTANAENKGNFAKPAGEDFTPVTTPTNYYFTEQLNVANKGAADVENVEISFEFPTNDYLRVAVVEADLNGTITGTFSDCIYDNAGTSYEGVETATTTTEITPESTSYTVDVGTLAGKTGDNEFGDIKYYNIYVWFEGQDEQCVDANAGQSIPDINFTVSGSTVDQV